MSVKSKIKTITWSMLGLCCVTLLVSAIKTQDSKACAGIDIKIDGATQNVFIKKDDVLNILHQNNINTGETLEDINLRKTEDQLQHNAWIKDAQLFFDNHQALHVNISEREPVARVFTLNGNSFYIDSNGLRLPVTENATARLIVFTSFPSDKKILSRPDSMVLNDVKTLAQYINSNKFFSVLTSEINITQQGMYEIIPVIGNQIIRIGNADSLNEKFNKLMAFYQEVYKKVGFEKYSVINVQYKDEVVAIKRGESFAISDTAQAIKQLKHADRKLGDVLDDTLYSAPVIKPKDSLFITAPAPVKSSSKVKQAAKIINYETSTKAKKTSAQKNSYKKPKAVMKKTKQHLFK